VLAGASLAALTALIALPTVGPLSTTLKLAENVSSSDTAAVADPGNLVRPLKFLQTFGVWLGESHRVEPRYLNQTYLGLGVVLVCLALGISWLVRRRAWSLLGPVAAMLVVFEFLHRHATTWTNAKLLMLLSPVAVFVALLGSLGLMRRRAAEGLVLTAVVIAAVLASDALLYHGTNLAPTARMSELSTIDARFAGQGPTLAPDFEEYDLYLLRSMAVDIPGAGYSGPFDFVGGAVRAYGHSYDLDSLALSSVERFRTIVMRRSPAWSRPPGNFKLIWRGRYYSAWRRVGPAPLLHVPLGTGFVPAAVPSCRAIANVAAKARRAGAQISFAQRSLNVSVSLDHAALTPAIAVSSDLEGRPQFSFNGPARLETGFRVRAAGRYEVWLGGDVDRPLEVQLDGRRIGAPSAQSGDDGTVIDVGSVNVRAGKHLIRLVRGGGDLRPDDTGSTVVDGIVLEPGGGAEAAAVRSIPANAWHSLCGQPLDWIEIR
jgi:hypothetical protein